MLRIGSSLQGCATSPLVKLSIPSARRSRQALHSLLSKIWQLVLNRLVELSFQNLAAWRLKLYNTFQKLWRYQNKILWKRKSRKSLAAAPNDHVPSQIDATSIAYPSVVTSPATSDTGVPQPAAHHVYHHSHVSLPRSITTDRHIQVVERLESDSFVQAVPDGGFMTPELEASLSHERIRPFVPEQIQRYDRNVKVPKEYLGYKIPPLTTSFDMPNTPVGWKPCFHPEGALYFFNPKERIFTDANLYEADVIRQIHSDVEVLEEFFRANNIHRSAHVDLVLELSRTDNQIETFYYLVDHSKRCIFFLDEYDASNLPIWYELHGISSPTHVKHEIETQYWYHCLMYPAAIELTHELANELCDVIIHSMGDQIISTTSTVPYSVEDLQKMLSLANSLKKNVNSKFHGAICLLSGLMYVFVRQRFYNFHGQPSARLGRDQSVYGKAKHKRSWLILCLSPILFFAPEVHLRALEKIWIDGITRNVLWTEFMSKLYAEWQEFTLYGTVLLNANVAFLAIQSVDGAPTSSRSPAQIASYASIAASIGTIILGLLLVRQNRSKGRDNVVDASTYLHKRSNQALGLETLAIMFALPYTLLMWGMVSFLFAFLFICFSGSDAYTRLFIGATWFAIACLIICCIWMAWEQLPEAEHDEPPPQSSDQDEKLDDDTSTSKWSRIVYHLPNLIFQRASLDADRPTV